jgi:NADH-quinone oxidoreductase subunit E
VPDGAIVAIADVLGIPAADVEGVATFYNKIFRQPVGRHVIFVCDSIGCFLTGYEDLIAGIKQHLGIEYGQTTPMAASRCCRSAVWATATRARR